MADTLNDYLKASKDAMQKGFIFTRVSGEISSTYDTRGHHRTYQSCVHVGNHSVLDTLNSVHSVGSETCAIANRTRLWPTTSV